MPEIPNPKLRQPPPPSITSVAPARLPYAELDVKTNFSFLRGASHADELVYRAAELGYRAIAVTDFNSLAGAIRMHEAAKEVKLKLLVGARLKFVDASDLLVWSPNRDSYAAMCRLLTLGKRRTEKGECELKLQDFLNDNAGLLAAVVTYSTEKGRRDKGTKRQSERPAGGAPPAPFVPLSLRPSVPFLSFLKSALGNRLSLAVSCSYGSDDATYLREHFDLFRAFGIPLLATNDVYYHDPSRRMLHDVLTCVHHGCTIQEAGFKLFPNAERYLKSSQQMHRLFADYPQAIHRGIEIVERCEFSLDSLRYEYPHELVPEGRTTLEYLAELTWRGAAARYPDGIPDRVRGLIAHELKLIAQLKFEPYFLTVYDLVRFARSRGILCQGRGSAANSAVCYCLGVTSVNPARIDLLFERFISAARNEPPDIDIDFEHERREEVIQYVYEKYGRDRAGMTATVITYRGRSAIRDVGKAMGLSLDMVDTMAGKLDWWDRGVLEDDRIRQCGLDPADRTIRHVIHLATELLGFPRHLSQHVGGLVMTRGLLCEMVPIENATMEGRTVIEWDKDDIDALGLLKVDVLALGMLTCISKAFRLIETAPPLPPGEELCGTAALGCVRPKVENRSTKCFPPSAEHSRGRLCHSFGGTQPGAAVPQYPLPKGRRLELHTIPAEDPEVYNMAGDADTLGVFQIESRAQMAMLPRLRPRNFYDLVIEVAIVRPGPIQGNMVHPYLKRRSGEEEVIFPSPALYEVLKKTLGVPLFQEQAMKISMVAAGFTADEADKLRRAMAAWRRSGAIDSFHQKIVQGMLDNGYTLEFAEQCFQQIKGFGEYGFPESHAASFALLVYVSAWLKRYHPAAFAAALINSQPMGFYQPAQIVRDAKEHGVEVRPVDVNESIWDCILEEGRDKGTEGQRDKGGKETWGIGGPALRLGFRQLKGMPQAHADRLVEVRNRSGRFTSIEELHEWVGLPVVVLKLLAEADAFGSMGLSRREALWKVLRLKDEENPLIERTRKGQRDRGTEGQSEKTPTWIAMDAPFVPLSLCPSVPSSPGPFVPISSPPSPLNDEPLVSLPTMPLAQEVTIDYSTAGLSLKKHPVALVREELAKQRILTAAELLNTPNARWVKVAGLVLIRQRPGTASGIVFETLEDETGIVNLIVKPDIYDRYRSAARHAALLQADGYVQRNGQVVHVMAKRLYDLSHLIQGYELRSRDFH
jgi:error-prone DNA polymerase